MLLRQDHGAGQRVGPSHDIRQRASRFRLRLFVAASTGTIRVVIIRVARFAEASVDGREWITDALRGVPGIRAAYHAAIPGEAGYISVAIADDEQAMEAGTQAIAQRRAELGIDGLGPDQISVYKVDHFVENLSGDVRPP